MLRFKHEAGDTEELPLISGLSGASCLVVYMSIAGLHDCVDSLEHDHSAACTCNLPDKLGFHQL